MSQYQWQFSSKFRRNAFGWRSQIPIQRIKEALSEIRMVARRDPILGAEGAVLFLTKISPSLECVDSSSGAIGNAVNNAIEILVPIIANAAVSHKERQQWLERLWEALQGDNIPYIEYLGEYWGELCVTPELAAYWADKFIEMVKHTWNSTIRGHPFYKGTTPCLSALYTAKRYQVLLTLLDSAPFKWWHDRCWGVKALVALGKPEEALKYAENSRGLNTPTVEIARACEAILLSMGLTDEAYNRYSLEANQTRTNLGTFRAIVKKYPNKSPMAILHDLIASQPGAEGKWFAAVKDAGFYDLAIKLVSDHPADPRTLARAAKEFCEKNPAFAMASGMASLNWIIKGYGYEISGVDVRAAYSAIIQAAHVAKISPIEINKKINALLLDEKNNAPFVKSILMDYLDG